MGGLCLLVELHREGSALEPIFQTNNKQKIKFHFFKLSMTTTKFSGFAKPFFVSKSGLKFYNANFTYLETSEGLLKITKIKDNKKFKLNVASSIG